MSHYPFVESVDGQFPAIEHSEGPHPCAILFCDVDFQCWTKGRSSTAVAEDLRPTATTTVAEV